MKWLVFLVGMLILIVGIIPLLYNAGIWSTSLDFIPVEGSLYQVMIIVLGGIVSWIGIYLKGEII